MIVFFSEKARNAQIQQTSSAMAPIVTPSSSQMIVPPALSARTMLKPILVVAYPFLRMPIRLYLGLMWKIVK